MAENAHRKDGIYDDMTAFDNMKMKAIALGMFSSEKINGLLKLVGLDKTGKKRREI